MAMLRPIALAVVCLLCACQATVPAPPPPTAAPVRSLVVVVTASVGVSVAGAGVCALTVTGREEGCGETNGTGTARLSVHPGTYALRVTPKPGTRFGPGQGWADVVDDDATAIVTVEPRSAIAGAVRDELGAVVAGAEVCAHPPGSRVPTCARSGGDGAYSIDVRSDVYKLEVSGPPGGKLIPQWARGRLDSAEADVVDARTDDVKGIDVVLLKGVLLRGVVRGPNGAIEGAQVCTRTLAAPLGWDCERTNKNGQYLALREPGTYYLWFVPPDDVRLMTQWYDHVLEGVDTTAIDLDRDRTIDASLDPGPQIRGKVRTEDGQPVAAALVCVDTPFPTGRICRGTASDGSYSVTTRPATYLVQVLAPAGTALISEYWSRKRFWPDADTLDLGSADKTLDLTLRRGVQVTGVVRDTRGIPLEAATINLLDGQGPLAAAATDTSGTYTIAVPAGRYQIEVFAPFRGERGDLLSQPARDLDVGGFTRYDVVLQDVNP